MSWFVGCWPLASCAGLALLLAAGLRGEPGHLPSPLIDRPAPPVILPLLHGGAGRWTPASMKGRVWVLNIWASWCAPCRAEHPLWVELARDAGITLVGLNYRDDPRAAAEWLLQLGDPYRLVVLDRDGRAGIDYGVYGVPETFVVDRDGVVRLKHVGPMTREAWAGEVLPLLRGLGA